MRNVSKQSAKRLEERQASLKSAVEKSKRDKRLRVGVQEHTEALLELIDHIPTCPHKTQQGKRFTSGTYDDCLRCLLRRAQLKKYEPPLLERDQPDKGREYAYGEKHKARLY